MRPRYEDVHERLAPMMLAIAGEYFAPGLTGDDLLQEARIGLWKACRDYDGRGAFKAFAALCVRRQVITAVVTATRGKHSALNERMSLDAPASQDSSDTALLGDVLPAGGDLPEARVELAEELRELALKMARLTELERGAVLHVANGGAYETCALGGSRKAVDNALQRARVKLAEPAPTPAATRRGVLLVDRSVHPERRDAIREAGRVRPGCRVIALEPRKVRRGRVVSTRGRATGDGSLGRPVWAVEIETAA